MSGAVLRNIEAGTKSELSVSQLLNIARALNVLPIHLLTSIKEPESSLDLPNLSDDLRSMTALEFDEWLSGSTDSVFEWTTVEDQSERNQLRAARELEALARERDRLTGLIEHVSEITAGTASYPQYTDVETLAALRTATVQRITRLTTYLGAAGWNVQRWL